MGEKISSEINIAEIMEAAKQKIHDGLVESIVEDLKNSLSWRMKEEIQSATANFFALEIAPELQKMMILKKEEILLGIQTALVTMGNELSKKMIAVLVEKVAKLSDYNIREVFKNIF